jgi:hypothetical protein
MQGRRRHILVEVSWCDPYLGYTVYEWLREVRDILEREHCVRLVVVKTPMGCGEGDPVVVVEGVHAIEGLPGEEGYLIEAVKIALDRLGARCGEGGPD